MSGGEITQEAMTLSSPGETDLGQADIKIHSLRYSWRVESQQAERTGFGNVHGEWGAIKNMNPAAQTESEFREEGRNRMLCSPMLGFPRTDADFIFHLAQEEPGPTPARSFQEHSKCCVRRAHFALNCVTLGQLSKAELHRVAQGRQGQI